MADHEFFGTVSVSEAPTASDHAARKAELDANATADRARANHTGSQSADTLTDGSTKVAMTTTERTKLTGIATAATANATDAALRDRSTHTGTQTADTIVDGTTNKVYTATEKTKLSGIATGATANSTDAALRDRATHTGTQPAATISDFSTAVDARVQLVVDAAPAALDTLNELAAALGDDPNFATTITGQLGALDTRIDGLEAATSTAYKTNIGNGTLSVFSISHGLNTVDCTVEVVRVSDGQTVYPVIKRTSATALSVDFGSHVPATSAYRVLVDPK